MALAVTVAAGTRGKAGDAGSNGGSMSFLARHHNPSFPAGSSQNLADLDSRTLLIVDDNEEMLYMIKNILSRELKVNILLAGDGPEALSILLNNKVDLILLDLLMPGVSGFETLRLIKNEDSLRYVPVLMFSAMDSLESAARCIMHGADDFLIKPFDPDLLRVKVSALLEKKKLRDIKNDFTLHLEKTNAELLRKVNQLDIALREGICASEDLRRDRSRLMIMTEAAMEGLVIHEQGIIIDCNKRFGAIFGVDHRMVTGMPIHGFVDEESQQPLIKAIHGGSEKWTLKVYRSVSGARRPMVMTGKLLASEGNWLSTISVRESGSGLRGPYLAGWSNDSLPSTFSQSVREPLATMASMINALATAELNPSAREQIITRLRSMADSMINLVDEQMDLDRFANGEISPSLAAANCWSMVEEIIEKHRNMAGALGVSLANKIPKGWNIITDSQLLMEALGSLVLTAIKSSTPDGAVSLEMSKNQENLPSISVRYHGSKTEGAPGKNQMGLLLAAHIMQALNGSLSHENQEDGDFTFYLTLPKAVNSTLVITGDRISGMKISKAMEQLGVDVSLALTTAEALGILGVAEPKVVVAHTSFTKSSEEETQAQLLRMLYKTDGPVVVSLVDRPGAEDSAAPESLEIPAATAAQTLPLLISGILGKR